ncbi:peptide ABC transporter substrate-binding protein [Lacticaseibacillus zeae]|uniref:Peptide ABC transporter substrate-binding protein n=1 Tax=Lacticaseibacillus zeae subsp. silagei TaxID=3068307 RepID=A0ABD7ZB45_LACZE|nr:MULTISPECIES: peptide ABC transporter substrate-binding protein [Lacticaseibacillus]MDE3314460.1 peptide ABC transporter substrate-binding protein [Lacticaseibacillus zeae]OFR98993.1 hypothetical protein HMPREF2861_05360 [Lactobacillus sp. HMSC068F07]WLV84086.1 peptide ABC transporter substrate-binding protein [Lacticaseibacillus sp. NCIMB 15475]WLV86841.1 peptide ABC transporter substrate-binding protein [Lacticaseibacillus sp. NCIMB 15474]
MLKRLAKIASAFSITLLLAGCGQQSSSKTSGNNTYKTMTSDIIATMDPAQFTDAVSGQTLTDTMAGLYRYKGNKLTSDLAVKTDVSADQKTYTFHLRHGSKWSDGTDVTAADFVFAWQRVVDPATKSPYAFIMSGIKNADAITAGKMAASQLGVKAPDKYTFVVSLDQPIPYFKSMTCLQTFDPVEKKAVEKYGKNFAKTSAQLTFNGPFILKNWKGTDDSWVEVKNLNYWNAKNVHLKKITYQAVKENSTAVNLYKSGKLDDVSVTGQTAEAAKGQSGYHVIKQPWETYLRMNSQAVPAFGNTKVRQALSMAINRKAFINKVLGDGSTPATSAVTTNLFYNAKTGADFAKESLKGGYAQYTTYNLKKARKLFKQGMAEVGQKTLNFTFLANDTPAAKETAEYLQGTFQNLSTTGIKVKMTIKTVPQKSWLQMGTTHQYGMMASIWGPDYPDAENFLTRYTSSVSNFSGSWSSQQYDQYMANAAGKNATKPQARWNDLLKANRLITKEQGIIPLYQWGTVHLTKPSVKGVEYTPNSLFQYIGATNK